MITDYKTISLFGKELFVKAEGTTPFNGSYPMPNEACFFHLKKGGLQAYSEEEKLIAHSQQSLLMKCGNYVVQFFEANNEEHFEAIMIHFHPDVMKKVYKTDIPSFLKVDSNALQTNMTKIDATVLINRYIADLVFYFNHPQFATEDIMILKIKEIILLLTKTKESDRIIGLLKNLYTSKKFHLIR